MQNYSNYLWLHVAKSIGSLKRLKEPRPRYGPSPVSLIYSHVLKDLSFILFAITAAGVVPCGGPKKSPRTSSIVRNMFSFWSFEISEGSLRNRKIIIGLDSFSYQRLMYLAQFGLYWSLY